MTQKKVMQWMLAAVLVCGSSFLSSCTEDNGDNPAKPEPTSTPSPTGNDRYQKPGSIAWYDAMLEKIRTYNRIR